MICAVVDVAAVGRISHQGREGLCRVREVYACVCRGESHTTICRSLHVSRIAVCVNLKRIYLIDGGGPAVATSADRDPGKAAGRPDGPFILRTSEDYGGVGGMHRHAWIDSKGG